MNFMEKVKSGEVAAVVAQKAAMQGDGLFLPHGSRLFVVPQGWESRAIAADPHALRCESLLEFEAALRDENFKVIFVPVDAMITDQDIEKLCQRNGIAKTIFKEARTGT